VVKERTRLAVRRCRAFRFGRPTPVTLDEPPAPPVGNEPVVYRRRPTALKAPTTYSDCGPGNPQGE